MPAPSRSPPMPVTMRSYKPSTPTAIRSIGVRQTRLSDQNSIVLDSRGIDGKVSIGGVHQALDHLISKNCCDEVGSAPGTGMRLRGYRYRQRHGTSRRGWQSKSMYRVRVRATALPGVGPIPQRHLGRRMREPSIRAPLDLCSGVFPMRSVLFDLHSVQTTRVCRAVEPRFR